MITSVTQSLRSTNQTLYGPYTTAYSYDALYQLTQATYPLYDASLFVPWSNQTHAWTYDAIGNRLTQTRTQNGGGTLDVATYAYNLSNHGPQLTGITHTDSEPAVTLTYDNNGNTATWLENGVTTTYVWDMDDKMTGLTTSDSSQSAAHVYAYNGDRLTRALNGTTWKYLYNKEDILRANQAGTPMYFTQGSGIDDVLAESKSGSIKYAYKNMLSSVTTLADAGGLVTNAYQYDAWGNARNWPNPTTDPNPYGYTGREWDVLGTAYYRARFLNTYIATFLSADPESWRMVYRYAGSCPVVHNDPHGLHKARVCCRPLDVKGFGHFKHCFLQYEGSIPGTPGTTFSLYSKGSFGLGQLVITKGIGVRTNIGQQIGN